MTSSSSSFPPHADFFYHHQPSTPFLSRPQTNPRYAYFRQQYFTAGDEDQFVSMWTQGTNTHQTPPKDLSSSLFHFQQEMDDSWKMVWEPFSSSLQKSMTSWSPIIDDASILQTFHYLFHTMKKAIFVSIREGNVRVFLPFSKIEYTNSWGSFLRWDQSRYPQLIDMFREINNSLHLPFEEKRVHTDPHFWYANNGLIRYEQPILEGDSGITMIHDMLQTVCNSTSIPDIDFFLNKRDFPMVRHDGQPGYENLYSHLSPKCPRDSYDPQRMIPILSMTTTSDHVDLPIPTWEDWCRASYQGDGRLFGKEYRSYPTIPWVSESHSEGIVDPVTQKRFVPFSKRIPMVVFRGSSTGLGCHYHNNPRLWFAREHLFQKISPTTQRPYLNCGITKWNLRPRKKYKYLETIPSSLLQEIPLLSPLSLTDQCQYQFILHLPGHSCAYRLSYELSSGSVILLYPSRYQLWYMSLLKPYVHYVPLTIHQGKVQIYETLEWCFSHPEACQRIAQQARRFYDTYLHTKGIISYWKQLLTYMATSRQLVSPLRSFCFWKIHHSQQNEEYHRYQKTQSPSVLSFIEQIRQYLSQTPRPLQQSIHAKIWKYSSSSSSQVWCIKQSSSPLESLHEWFTWKTLCSSVPCSTFVSSIIYDQEKNTLISPWVDGLTMDQWFIPEHFSSTQEAWSRWLRMTGHLCTALHRLQRSHGWVHFDLYPWNVMIPFASPSSPVILDLAKSSFRDASNRFFYHLQPFPIQMDRLHDIRCWIYSTCFLFLSRFRVTGFHVKSLYRLLQFLGCPFIHDIPQSPSIAFLKRILRHCKKFSVSLYYSDHTSSRSIKTCHEMYQFLQQFVPTYEQHLWSSTVSSSPFLSFPLPSRSWTWETLPSLTEVKQLLTQHPPHTLFPPSLSILPMYPQRPQHITSASHIRSIMTSSSSTSFVILSEYEKIWDAYAWILSQDSSHDIHVQSWTDLLEPYHITVYYRCFTIPYMFHHGLNYLEGNE